MNLGQTLSRIDSLAGLVSVETLGAFALLGLLALLPVAWKRRDAARKPMGERLPMRLSIVIPALDEARGIVATLTALQPLRRRGHEVIVVDGGSADATLDLAPRWPIACSSRPRDARAR